jgi:hypothetical protein
LTTTNAPSLTPRRISATRAGPPARMSSKPMLWTSPAVIDPPLFSDTNSFRSEAV